MGLREERNKELRHLLETDDRIVLLGQSIRDPYGGACKVTRGLTKKYDHRIYDMPIGEAAMIGTAVGMALEGKIPIVEIMFANFLTLCLDQITRASQMAQIHGIAFKVVIRAMWNGDEYYGPHHSGELVQLTGYLESDNVFVRDATGDDDVRIVMDNPLAIGIVMEDKQSY